LNKISPSREDLLNSTGGATYGKLFVEIGIGLITLLLAGFNYVNLTLARSLSRSKEIGVRKVIGASRKQVFLQFIVESVVISLLALTLSCVLLQLLKPMDAIQQVLLNANWNVQLWVTLISFSILTGIVAGSIPARILSALKPAMVIKGQKAFTVLRGLTLRKILVVAQFAISLTGIIFMGVMYKQMYFMATGDYGFAKNNILNIELYGTNHQKLRNEIQKIPGVESITAVSEMLGANPPPNGEISIPEKNISINADSADNTVLINEQAAAKLNFKNAHDAIGQFIRLTDSNQVRIIGVVKDFHYMSMFFPILPMIIRYEPKYFSLLQVKVNPGTNKETIKAAAEKNWKLLNPHQEFSAEWFDKDLYNRHIHGGDQLLMALLCTLVLSIACLGLLGMVTYSAELRTKEIGVRKIIGARVMQLLLLLSKDFVLLLLIAGLIAVPAGYIASTFFLYNFTYHINIGAGTLLAGFFTMFLIGGITIVWQTYRVATHNPVKSLRTE
jgi:putative ABC transport system permease protein